MSAVHDRHVREDGGFGARFVYLTPGAEDLEGVVMIEVCDTCHEIVMAVCEHSKNEWNAEGTTLTCQLCKMDVT